MIHVGYGIEYRGCCHGYSTTHNGLTPHNTGVDPGILERGHCPPPPWERRRRDAWSAGSVALPRKECAK